MDEARIAKVCKIIGKFVILLSFIVILWLIAFWVARDLFPDGFSKGLTSAATGVKFGYLFIAALIGIGLGCVFRWLGGFIEPKEPKDP